MLFCFVYIASHPRRSPASFLDQSPVPYAPAPKSLSHNLFADPHPLNLYATIFYKNMPGRGYSRPFDVETFQHADLPPFLTSLPHYLLTSSSLSPLAATLMDLPASVANKRLTVRLSPLAATLTKNTGGEPPQISHRSPPSPIFRILFQVPYLVSPAFATLTK